MALSAVIYDSHDNYVSPQDSPFTGINGLGRMFWKGAACFRSDTSSWDCRQKTGFQRHIYYAFIMGRVSGLKTCSEALTCPWVGHSRFKVSTNKMCTKYCYVLNHYNDQCNVHHYEKLTQPLQCDMFSHHNVSNITITMFTCNNYQVPNDVPYST